MFTSKKRLIAVFICAIVLIALSVLAFDFIGNQVEKLSITDVEITNGGRLSLEIGNTIRLNTSLPDKFTDAGIWSASNDSVTVDTVGNVTALSEGTVAITFTWNGLSDTVLIEITEPSDLLDSTERADFYSNYTVAASRDEALRRSELGLMSGNITVPEQAPTVSRYQPKSNDIFIRNSEQYFIDENTYVIVDAYGKEVMRIYRGGGYITLEEVAAYVFAFSDVPANYISGKEAEPEQSIWGEYLRLNHSSFNGDSKRYPYQPILPNISGCGGELYYYELDIGTTGTDCDPRYISKIYNDGHTITRGAARIVYARFDKNHNYIIEADEKYVFYTYNHYNDFQEYLNYYGGWGELFGNITGGGEISSKVNYAPTPYPPTVSASLKAHSQMYIFIPIYCYRQKYTV